MITRADTELTEVTSQEKRPKVFWRFLPWSILAAVTLLTKWISFYLPMNRDSGLFAYGGWRILHGALPYSGFFDNKLPGVYYINALAVSLFGPSQFAISLFGTLYAILTGWAFYALVSKFSRKSVALVVALLFVYYHCSYGLAEEGNYTECYIALPMMLSALLMLRWSERRNSFFLPVLAGVSGAAAVIIKQPALSIVIAAILFAFFSGKHRDYKTALSVAVGAAGVGIALIAWMASVGVLREAIQDNLVFNRLYFKDAYTAGLPVAITNLRAGMNLIALPLLGAVLAILTKAAFKTRIAGTQWIIVPWFVLDLLGIAMGGRFTNHYFLAILPSSMLLLAIFLDQLSFDGWRKWTAVAAGAALLFGPFWRILDPKNPSGVELSGSVVQQQLYATKWVINKRVGECASKPAEDIARWIKTRTTSEDKIYTWGWCTRVAFLANREICSKYLHMHPLGATGFDRDRRIKELAEDIAKNRPKYIIDENLLMPTTAPPLGKGGIVMPTTSQFFRLDGYEPVKQVVAQKYHPVANVSGYVVYELNPR